MYEMFNLQQIEYYENTLVLKQTQNKQTNEVNELISETSNFYRSEQKVWNRSSNVDLLSNMVGGRASAADRKRCRVK